MGNKIKLRASGFSAVRPGKKEKRKTSENKIRLRAYGFSAARPGKKKIGHCEAREIGLQKEKEKREKRVFFLERRERAGAKAANEQGKHDKERERK